MYTPRELQALYKQGKNITQVLREQQGIDHNAEEIIEIAYDLQTGSYISALENPQMAENKRNYTSEIAKTILSLCEPTSIMEAGIGEGTTFSGVLKNLGTDVESFGFDLSWSRVAYAKRWLHGKEIYNTTLCTGNLLHIPFSENSIDVVYTSHSIEPNRGKEALILQELFRVTRKFLILLEPGYELANDKARRRMDSHGYCRNLCPLAESLGYNIAAHDLFPFTSNPLNPTAITIIEKRVSGAGPQKKFACPNLQTPLEEIGGMLFSPEALVVYPIIGSIPCLRIENGIFASRYKEIIEAG